MACLVSRSGRELQRYTTHGGRQVVGCIPYRFKKSDGDKKRSIISIDDELEVMLITSQKGDTMMFPKGGWEIDESIEQAASRESYEEAGVLGLVQPELGKWNFISKRYGTYYEGYMFPLLVEEELEFWPEQNARQRIWMSVSGARQVCQHWWMKEALDILVNRLAFHRHNKQGLEALI